MENVGTESSSRVAHRPRVLRIKRIVEETPTIKSFYVNCPEVASVAHPGQFVMVWVIGTDEIPMSISGAGKDGELRITVERVGDATERLHALKVGDQIGIRGPYGNWFDLSGEKLLMVGGGDGVAPLAFGAEVASSQGKEITAILGAKTSSELLFRSRMEELSTVLKLTTEDGSAGVKGLATDLLEETLRERKFDSLLACGPEPMLKKVFDIAKPYRVPVQISLERMMKCAIGLCGSCCVGPYRVCTDGPIFMGEQLERVSEEFGVFKRDKCGRKVQVAATRS